MRAWLGQDERLAAMSLEPASSDASFRRYFRLQGDGESFIVMDAPPPQEDCLPFVRIAGYLEAMGLNAPRVVDIEFEQGFLLLSDLGDQPYLDALVSSGSDSRAQDQLYDDALAALATMQRRGAAYQAALPPYDATLLDFELSLFHDWLCGTHLGIELTTAEEMQWRDTCSLLIRNALDQPQVFVHRDYHSRNLMVTPHDNPGILDFQDAVEGPLTYDLVSLLKDSYIRWPAERVVAWANSFYDRLAPELRAQTGRRQFIRSFELMGVQRHVKVAGIFARLNHRDGKSAYLADIPLALDYILDVAPRYEELAFLATLVAERCLPAFGESP